MFARVKAATENQSRLKIHPSGQRLLFQSVSSNHQQFADIAEKGQRLLSKQEKQLLTSAANTGPTPRGFDKPAPSQHLSRTISLIKYLDKISRELRDRTLGCGSQF